MEYESDLTRTIDSENGVGAEIESDTVEDDVASMDDAASRMITDSNADDDGVVAPVAAPAVEVPVDNQEVKDIVMDDPPPDHVPPVINLSCPDDLSTYDCVPASRSIASDTTTLTRHSTITVDTIPLINNVFKDSLV